MSQYSDSQFNFSDPNSSWKMTLDNIPQGSTVLDIGCSSGNFAQELIKRKQCIVDGIELNDEDAKIASKKLRKVFVANIETDTLPSQSYDIIFMGDVIEHLAQPIPALNRLRKLLNENGKIVFSIPNITHMLVRMMLLQGKIEYGKTGLLDETHLHFYNQKEIFRVFNSAGFRIDTIDYVMRDIPVELLKKELSEIGLEVSSGNKFAELVQSVDGAAYQFVGVASVSDSAKTQPLPEKSPINVNDKYMRTAADGYKKKIRNLEAEIYELKMKLADFHDIAKSNSYRIGRKITYPIRMMKYLKRHVGKRYVMSKNISRVKEVIKRSYGITMVSPTSRPSISLVIRSIEHPTSSTFIRLLSPLSAIVKKSGEKIEIIDGDKPKISSSSKIIIVQRTALLNREVAEYVVANAKKNNAKLFVDTDDAFNQIDENHPQYELQKERVEALDFVIQNADQVWFSTSKLQSVYDVKNSKVIRNTLDGNIWKHLSSKHVREMQNDKPLEMLYMGTKTHDSDFDMIYPALEKLHKKYEGKFRLHIVGVTSKYEKASWIVEHKPVDGLYPNFISWLSDIGPFDIGISPLQDTPFNANKSDIKALDYLALGVKPLVSDVEAYKNTELTGHIVRVKNTSEAWLKALESEIKSLDKQRGDRRNRILDGYEYVLKTRSTDVAARDINKSLHGE